MAARFVADFGLPEYDATTLTQSKAMAAYFEATAKACGQPSWPATGSWARCHAA
jgi:aspartyl-tRNA(Asn)/glutamyl-tRNA(Gln) amidotransferase subunit B